jgi:hypothetical protein
MILQMPMISYEEIGRQQILSEQINQVLESHGKGNLPTTPQIDVEKIDEAVSLQIRAYLMHNPPLHVRRYVDFFGVQKPATTKKLKNTGPVLLLYVVQHHRTGCRPSGYPTSI